MWVVVAAVMAVPAREGVFEGVDVGSSDSRGDGGGEEGMTGVVGIPGR